MASKRTVGTGPSATPGQGPLTVFVHIPHAAGTTFTTVLRDNFPDGVRPTGNAFRPSGGFNSRPLRRMDDAAVFAREARVLAGQVPFGALQKLPRDTRYVTFLREPVERVVSQYYAVQKFSRKKPLPGDGSLEATLSAGDVIYDNLQTRMLSDQIEPAGEVDDHLLEQAKENLRSRFTAFGIVERFDESLVLLAQQLGLESILYMRQRFAARPRGKEVPEEMVRVAEQFNRFDAELYRWALELFEQRVGEQGPEFQVELAAMHAARNGESSEPPAAATPEELWALLVRARAAALRDRLDRASADSAQADEIRAVLERVDAEIAELSNRMGVAAPAGGHGVRALRAVGRNVPRKRATAATATRVAALEEARDSARRELEEIRSEARSAEESTGDKAQLEAQRLRTEAVQAERRLEEIEQRFVRARTKLDNATAGEAAAEAAADAAEVGEPVVIPDRLPPEVFEQRSTFFDAAELFTELLCTQVGSSRMFVRTRDQHIGRALFLKQGRGDMKLLHRCVATVASLLGEDVITGRVLIDVGANIGSTSVHAVHDGLFKHVVAIEPDPENFETLRLNLLLNGVEERSTAIQAAASDTEGNVSLVVNPTRSGKHWVATGSDKLRKATVEESPITVEAITLDSLAAKGVYDPADVGLLWIDAEHHEGQILSGATELTSRGVPAVFEWDPAGLDNEEGGRTLISDALAGHYTHFVDMRATDVPGQPKYQLRPIAELAEHTHPARTREGEHFTEILALRLEAKQVPEENLLSVLRRGRRTRRGDVQHPEASTGDAASR